MLPWPRQVPFDMEAFGGFPTLAGTGAVHPICRGQSMPIVLTRSRADLGLSTISPRPARRDPSSRPPQIRHNVIGGPGVFVVSRRRTTRLRISRRLPRQGQ